MFNNTFKNKKVLVTGNTGFKGSWLSAWFVSLGADVYGISKDVPTSPSLFDILKLYKKTTHYQEDIRNIEKITKIISDIKPDFVFHLAAQPIVSLSYQDPLETISSNVMGTANVLEALRTLENECVVVVITSDKCYDNVEWEWGYKEIDHLGGKDIYSGSKGAAELIYKSYFYSFLKNKPNILSATARAGNVIGGGDWAKDRIVPDMVKAWSEQKSVEIRSPKSTRPWQHVLEPLSGYLALAQGLKEKPSLNGMSFNFGPDAGNNHTVEELINSIAKYWVKLPEKHLIINEVTTFHEAKLLKLNCDRALFELKWIPVLDFKVTAEFTGSWYNNYYNNTSTNMFEFTMNQIDKYVEAGKNKEIVWTQK